MEDEYERVLLIKNEIFIFKIPPRTTNRALRASDWKLDNPDWTGRLKLVAKGDKCILKIEDKTSGQLFAKCPIDAYPGPAVEPVSDSSRYFVIRVQDDNGRSAFIGMGFADRGDSFDFNVALQDHFKCIEKQSKLEQEDSNDSQPKLDLKFKEGETIKVNLNIAKKSGSGSGKNKSKVSGAVGILPPPPGAMKIPAPPGNNISITKPESDEFSSPVSLIDPVGEETEEPQTSAKEELDDLFDDFDSLSLSRLAQKSENSSTSGGQAATIIDSSNSSDLWANFGTASPNSLPLSSNQQQQQAPHNWANF